MLVNYYLQLDFNGIFKMADTVSTDDFLLFLSEQVSTEVVDGFDDDVDGRSLVTSQVGSDALMVHLHPRFSPVPFVDAVAISCSIAFLSLFHNSFVIVFYRKTNTSARPYILLLAALDLKYVHFILLPNVGLGLMEESVAKTVLKTIRRYAGSCLFLLYLVPTFYLALDRFLAVFFPHKFKVLAPKMRPFKVGLFVVSILLNVAHFAIEMIIPGNISLIPFFIGWFIVLIMLLVSPVLYVAIFCQLMVSARKMAGHTASGASNQR